MIDNPLLQLKFTCNLHFFFCLISISISGRSDKKNSALRSLFGAVLSALPDPLRAASSLRTWRPYRFGSWRWNKLDVVVGSNKSIGLGGRDVKVYTTMIFSYKIL